MNTDISLLAFIFFVCSSSCLSSFAPWHFTRCEIVSVSMCAVCHTANYIWTESAGDAKWIKKEHELDNKVKPVAAWLLLYRFSFEPRNLERWRISNWFLHDITFRITFAFFIYELIFPFICVYSASAIKIEINFSFSLPVRPTDWTQTIERVWDK